MLVGVDIEGKVTGVHVLAHRETPGLGDRIQSDKSDWVQQFDGRSLGNPVAGRWKIKRDGGDFDQLSGASVTPRAVVKAVRQTLEYFDANAMTLFAAAADAADEVAE
jgi:electron transport complex protein RnfG